MLKLSLVLGEWLRGDTVKFLEILNERQAQEIQYLRDQNKQLLDKLLYPKQRSELHSTDSSLEPVGRGYIRLADKVQELERQSADEYWKREQLINSEEDNAS